MRLLPVALFLLTAFLAPVLHAAEDPPATPAAVVTVDINSADAATLASVLDGVGPQKAQAIVDYRAANGPFHSVDELGEVSGIGPATLERNRERILINP